MIQTQTHARAHTSRKLPPKKKTKKKTYKFGVEQVVRFIDDSDRSVRVCCGVYWMSTARVDSRRSPDAIICVDGLVGGEMDSLPWFCWFRQCRNDKRCKASPICVFRCISSSKINDRRHQVDKASNAIPRCPGSNARPFDQKRNPQHVLVDLHLVCWKTELAKRIAMVGGVENKGVVPLIVGLKQIMKANY